MSQRKRKEQSRDYFISQEEESVEGISIDISLSLNTGLCWWKEEEMEMAPEKCTLLQQTMKYACLTPTMSEVGDTELVQWRMS